MSDSAHNVNLVALLVDSVAHGLAIYSQRLVLLAICFVPALQGAVQICRINTDKHIADNVITGDNIAAVFTTAIETLPCFGTEALRPIRYGLISSHSTEDCPSHYA